MKIHDTLIERLIKLYETYGGHRDEHKLKSELKRLDVSIYTRESGEQILVNQADLNSHTTQR